MTQGGAYILFLEFEREVKVRVGGLGIIEFSPGVYAYVGSARRGLRARIRRHLKDDKEARWHIDYLTPHAVERWATMVPSRDPPECFISRRLHNLKKKVVKGFGAGDCSCPSHLVYLGESSIRKTHSVGN